MQVKNATLSWEYGSDEIVSTLSVNDQDVPLDDAGKQWASDLFQRFCEGVNAQWLRNLAAQHKSADPLVWASGMADSWQFAGVVK